MTGDESSADVLHRALSAAGPTIAIDPRPPAAIRVGGIGHREIPERSRERISATLKRTLNGIEAAARDALTMPGVGDSYSGPPVFALITPLAEGADRLIAQAGEGKTSPWRLGAILPFSPSVYENTFDLEADPRSSVAEFRHLLEKAALPTGYGTFVLDFSTGTESERNAGYRTASSAIVRWCDVLIGVVEHARMESETGHGLKEAIASNVPLIVIDPAEPDDYRLILDGVEVPRTSDADAALRSTVEALLRTAPKSASPHEMRSLTDYARERVGYGSGASVDFEHDGPYVARTVAAGWIAWGASISRSLRTTFRAILLRKSADRPGRLGALDLPFDDATSPSFVENFLRYNRADALARLYGDLHRGVQIVSVFVGLLAALAALVQVLAGDLPASYFTLFEFACLAFMYAAVRTGHRQRWLQRWIDYRLLAEILRHAKFLALVGRPSPFADLRPSLARQDVRVRHWVENHVRAVLRAQPIAVPGRTAKAENDALTQLKTYVAERLALDQMSYHAETANYERSLDTLLRRTLDVVTPTTIALIGLKFMTEVWTVDPWLREGLEIPLILLPAVASGIIALRATNQYAVTARRSDGMVTAMKFHHDSILAAKNVSDLGERGVAASRVLLGEVEGWTDVFSDRHIEIEV